MDAESARFDIEQTVTTRHGLFAGSKTEYARSTKCRLDVVTLAEAFGATGLKIEAPDQIASTLKRALATQGPVLIGVPVDYRDNHRLMEMVLPNVLN